MSLFERVFIMSVWKWYFHIQEAPFKNTHAAFGMQEVLSFCVLTDNTFPIVWLVYFSTVGAHD